MIICKLILYNTVGEKIKETPFESIYTAVETGYESGYDFNVIEREGGGKRIYWAGSKRDKKRADFPAWGSLAEEKDYQS